jgi:hypothetical protein
LVRIRGQSTPTFTSEGPGQLGPYFLKGSNMLFLLFDYETSGLDPAIHSIVEYGVVLWDTTLNRVVREAGSIIFDPAAVWDPKVLEVHNITPEL